MILADFNPVAVIVLAILNVILGMLWYSPQVLGKVWMQYLKEHKDMTKKECEECWRPTPKEYIGAFVVSLITVWVLALFIDWLDAISFLTGATVGFLAWLGFTATTLFSSVIWCKKPLPLFAVDAGFYLVSYIIIGGILGAWQ